MEVLEKRRNRDTGPKGSGRSRLKGVFSGMGKIECEKNCIKITGNKKELEILKEIISIGKKICENGCYRGEGDWECETCWINGWIDKMEREVWKKEEDTDTEQSEVDGDEAKPKIKLGSGRSRTIVIDFDGVIHKGYKGYKDGTIYGEIDKELVEWIKELRSKGVHVCIMSNRDSKQIVEFMNKWCEENKVKLRFMKTGELFWDSCGSSDLVGVTNRKVAGMLYVDDKGYRYEGVEKLKEDFDEMFEIEG